MLSFPSRLLFGLSGLAFVVAAAYAIVAGDRAGALLFAATGAAGFVAAFAVLGTVGDTAPYVPADAPPPARRAGTPGPGARPGQWPLLTAFALGLLAIGPAVDRATVYGGLVAVAICALGWFGLAWREHPTWTSRVSSRVTDRLLVPVVLPLFAFGMAATIAISVSRILLAVNKDVSVIIALTLALTLLVAFFTVASRPTARSTGLVALAAVAGVTLVGAGIAGASSGERAIERRGEAVPVVRVAARGVKYSTDELRAPAGREVAIDFHNFDRDVYHNVAVYLDQGDQVTPVFNGQGIPGEKRIVYRHTFQAGTYRFQCDFHTNMKGQFVVST